MKKLKKGCGLQVLALLAVVFMVGATMGTVGIANAGGFDEYGYNYGGRKIHFNNMPETLTTSAP